jgi:23S rRNA (cytosine1962-C5)-methyltransferase
MPLKANLLESFQSALNKRKPLESITNALRLVNSQGDGLDGLVLERYDKHFVAQIFHPFWLKEVQALKSLLSSNFQVDFLIIKDRTQSILSNPEDIQTTILVENASSKTVVIENGLKFEVDLNDTLNTVFGYAGQSFVS